jgi:hypothetical protein
MTRYFGTTWIEDFWLEAQALEQRIKNLENRKDIILPFRDNTNFPPGQEGQVVLAESEE